MLKDSGSIQLYKAPLLWLNHRNFLSMKLDNQPSFLIDLFLDNLFTEARYKVTSRGYSRCLRLVKEDKNILFKNIILKGIQNGR